MNISAKFHFIPHIASEELIFEYFSQIEPFSWQPIKLRGLNKKYNFGRGPRNKHF